MVLECWGWSCILGRDRCGLKPWNKIIGKQNQSHRPPRLERVQNAPNEAWDRALDVSFMREKCVRNESSLLSNFCKRHRVIQVMASQEDRSKATGQWSLSFSLSEAQRCLLGKFTKLPSVGCITNNYWLWRHKIMNEVIRGVRASDKRWLLFLIFLFPLYPLLSPLKEPWGVTKAPLLANLVAPKLYFLTKGVY